MNYYNEYDKKAAAWLRELINDGLIPAGVVDERSIVDVRADELREYTQCHFFAGIGGWSYALQLAGWPEDKPVWTGSCPCQPYSTAGKGKGNQDKRNLWPHFYRLIRECHPDTIFGEQVAAAIGYGWLDGVCSDLEAEGYAVGSCVLGAHSVGAPHIRQRLWWVAHAGLCHGSTEQGDKLQERNSGVGEPIFISDGLADSIKQGQQGGLHRWKSQERKDIDRHFGRYRTVNCSDGKTRRIPAEPSLFPLAHGLPGRVGLLRGAGNAITPQVAAEFIKASTE